MSITSAYSAYPVKQEFLTIMWDMVCPQTLPEKVCQVSSDLLHGGLSVAKAIAAPTFMLAGANLALKGIKEMGNMERAPRPPAHARRNAAGNIELYRPAPSLCDKMKHYAKNGGKILGGAAIAIIGFQQIQTEYSFFGTAYNDVTNLPEKISSRFE